MSDVFDSIDRVWKELQSPAPASVEVERAVWAMRLAAYRRALSRVVAVWDSLDGVPAEEPVELHERRMQAAVDSCRDILEETR